MQVAIITEGGGHIGLGHISRCLSLWEEFRNKCIQPLILVNREMEGIPVLSGEHIIMRYFDNDRKAIGEILEHINGFDCAIIDSYRFKEYEYRKIQRNVRLLVSIDDNKRINYPSGIVINSALYAKSLHYPPSNRIKYFLGPKFASLRREFKADIYKKISPKISSLLITFGGDDVRKITGLISKFVSAKFPRLRQEIIIGSFFKNKKSFKNSSNSLHYHFSPAPGKIIKLMRNADIAISAGGQTIYELAMVGTPTLGVCVAQNQLRNLESWDKIGFLKNCGWYDSKSLLKNIAHALNGLQDKAVREKMALKGKKNIDGRGAPRIVKAIIDLLK